MALKIAPFPPFFTPTGRQQRLSAPGGEAPGREHTPSPEDSLGIGPAPEPRAATRAAAGRSPPHPRPSPGPAPGAPPRPLHPPPWPPTRRSRCERAALQARRCRRRAVRRADPILRRRPPRRARQEPAAERGAEKVPGGAEPAATRGAAGAAGAGRPRGARPQRRVVRAVGPAVPGAGDPGPAVGHHGPPLPRLLQQPRRVRPCSSPFLAPVRVRVGR